jgi:diadenylate cyclase
MSNFSAFIKSAAESFATFTIVDAIDILLLSGLLYFLFHFVFSRKSNTILVGIAICLLLFFATFIFNLKATHFLLNSVVRMGGLALLILFQPEIRDAIEKIGTGALTSISSIGDRKKKEAVHSAIEEICRAVEDLSRTRTGALIAITRTTKIDDVIQTGIAVNADVNSFLLRNLFFHKAPLHDGAVVIENARIAAAGCLLPLTRRSDVDSDLGTRHRAAIGLSETSDAVIIIVSEETGIISVANDCTLTRNYTPETLKSYLQQKVLREHQDSRSVIKE